MRVTRVVLGGVVIVGSLALWTAVPIGWLHLTGTLMLDGGTRFVLVLFGIPVTMILFLTALSRIEGYRRSLDPEESDGSGVGLLEVMLVASAVIALIALITWWSFIPDGADPSGPLQPI